MIMGGGNWNRMEEKIYLKEVKNLREYIAIEIFRNDHWSSWAETLVLSFSVNKGSWQAK